MTTINKSKNLCITQNRPDIHIYAFSRVTVHIIYPPQKKDLISYHISSKRIYIQDIISLDIQGTFLVGEQICRRFTAAICMIQKNVINIFLRLIYWLCAYEKSAMWLKKCTDATMQCNTSQISPACQTYIKPILLI